MTSGSEDAEWERKRTLEQEAERQLQKRIKDRVPQKRAKGKAKTGDIDGAAIVSVVVICDVIFTVHRVVAVLDQIQDDWEPCTSTDVRLVIIEWVACNTILTLPKVQPRRSCSRTSQRIVPWKRHELFPIY